MTVVTGLRDERPPLEPGEIRQCKNSEGGCPNSVPPPKKHGRPRLFCSVRCGANYHSRRYYQRELGTGELIVQTTAGEPHFRRRQARTAKTAREHYLKHHDDCPLGENGECPAKYDAYGLKRECLIKAVLIEDWRYLLQTENRSVPTPRYLTTEDGRWLPETETESIRRSMQ